MKAGTETSRFWATPAPGTKAEFGVDSVEEGFLLLEFGTISAPYAASFQAASMPVYPPPRRFWNLRDAAPCHTSGPGILQLPDTVKATEPAPGAALQQNKQSTMKGRS
jgi:hypothetical protein